MRSSHPAQHRTTGPDRVRRGPMACDRARTLARDRERKPVLVGLGADLLHELERAELGHCDFRSGVFGTGYFGVRDEKGFSMDKLEELVNENSFVRAIEVKLSQGAKPGKGGVLPAAKITQEIANILLGAVKVFDSQPKVEPTT